MPPPRRVRLRVATCAAAFAVLAGVTACGGEVDRVPIETEDVLRDPFKDVPAERLPVVVRASTYLPRSLDAVRVTDIDQVREQLGEPPVGPDGPEAGSSPPARDLWSRADEEAALLTGGLLRGPGKRLERDYGFGPDDVLWEAMGLDEDGELADAWVIAVHRGVDPAALQRAVDDGVGPLAGGEVLPARRIVLGGSATPAADDSWRETRAVIGAGTQRSPESVYLRAGCVPLEDALGNAGVRRAERLREKHGLDEYAELEAFAVVFGDEVATARLGTLDYGAPRADIFARSDLVEGWPSATRPAFARAFGNPVIDPGSGRMGFSLRDPAAAAQLTARGIAPYAVCAED